MQVERLKILLEVLKAEPNDPFNRYAVAMELRGTSPEAAQIHLEQLLVEFPEYLPTYYQLAVLYAEADDVTAAMDVFERGISLAQLQGNTKAQKELSGVLAMYRDEWES